MLPILLLSSLCQAHTESDWWKEAVIYQIYPRSFSDSNGDGIGDLQGIIQKLDYLDWLGVDAIWLSPIFLSPQHDLGYDISNYRAIDPSMGTMADVEELIEKSHERDLKIIFDGVFNHSSEEHSWFIDSLHQRNDKNDWYIWQREPNNWVSAFGGSAWTYHPIRGEYYLHSFTKEQPDLNWQNPKVQYAILSEMEFWYRKGVDGFRLDVFNSYIKDAQFRDNPKKKDITSKIGGFFYPYLKYQHLYDRDQEGLFDILREMRNLADHYDAMLIGETLDETLRYEKASSYVGDEYLQMSFHFQLLHSDWKDIPTAIQDLYDDYDKKWPTIVLSNHDFARQSKRWGAEPHKQKLMATLQLTLLGTPFIYYGEEIGLPEGTIKKDELQDPVGLQYYPWFKGRDGARTPMQWNTDEYSGFSTETPWLPTQENDELFSVSQQQADIDSILNVYRQLLNLRKKNAVLHEGIIEIIDSDDLLVYQRKKGAEIWEIALNFSAKKQAYQVAGDVVFSTMDYDGLVLAPYQAVIVRKYH